MPLHDDPHGPRLQVSDAHYLAIGKVIVHWAVLEKEINSHLGELRNHPRAAPLAQKRIRKEFSQRARAWRDLAQLVYADDPPRLKRLLDLIDRSCSCREDRDWVAHSLHGYDGNDAEQKLRAALITDGLNEPVKVRRRYHNPPRLNELTDRIWLTLLELSSFRTAEVLRALGVPPPE